MKIACDLDKARAVTASTRPSGDSDARGGVDLDVKGGEFSAAGPNGAGKTTSSVLTTRC